jgi:hypothetical protein
MTKFGALPVKSGTALDKASRVRRARLAQLEGST